MSRDDLNDIPSFTANREEAVSSAPRGAIPPRAPRSEAAMGLTARLVLTIALAVADIMGDKNVPYLVAGSATTETTNSKCNAMTTNWAYNTYTLAKGSVQAQLDKGLDKWYFITVDYTFGKAWQEDATRFIEAAGGEVVGSTLHPLGATDFSSQLLQAQASGATVIGIANAGADLANYQRSGKVTLSHILLHFRTLSVTLTLPQTPIATKCTTAR